ncbi:hypothetical protein V496_09876 [Pseudogymnoascus sp. VKM F-4515 (FW-2607)]|nr:hypothetical protein V496_09876 [Pseudogymnoascus sp. VKM F-4515 (FW-2607)]
MAQPLVLTYVKGAYAYGTVTFMAQSQLKKNLSLKLWWFHMRNHLHGAFTVRPVLCSSESDVQFFKTP